MRRALYILMSLAVGVMMACRSNHYEISGDASCQFNLVVAPYDGQIAGRAADLQPITTLVAAIYDDKGNKVDKYVAINYATGFTRIDIEGLRDGRYTLSLMAIGEQRTTVQLVAPATLSGEWIPQRPSQDNTYNEYLFATTPFLVSNGECETQNVTLRHTVSSIVVNVETNYPNWPGGQIDSINLDFVGALFASNQTLDGAYTGYAQQSMKVGVNGGDFYLLPASTTDKILGHATIIGKYADGKECRIEREFEMSVVANYRQVVDINFNTSDADNLGLIRFYDVDRKKHRSRKVWQDGCDRSEYLGGQAFYPTKPIQIAIDAGKKELKTTFYGGFNLKDVTVLCRRASDVEFFEVAWFESIQPFEERRIDFSANIVPKLYRTESGKMVLIDGIESMSGVEIKYKSEETFIKKIQMITWPGYLTFNSGEYRVVWCEPGSPFPPAEMQSLIVRPVYVREAMALMTNVAYILSSQRWVDFMLENEKNEFYHNDKAKTPISFKDVILPRIMQSKNLNLSVINPRHQYTLHGVANVGNGDYFSLREFVIIEHYTSVDRCNTFYHEMMHTCGYGHEGNLTYGTFCDQVPQHHVSRAAELPYYSASILHSWDNPNRFR